MITTRPIRVLLLASSFATVGAFAANPIDEIASHDGLTKVEVKGLDLAYARKDTNFAGYGKLIVEPVEVAFHKNWNPTRPGSHLKLGAGDRENIRTGVAKIVQEEFERALQPTYPLAKEAGPDVLRVRAKVLNLIANAPDTKTAGAHAIVMSSGEMTLLLELYDSETGSILARVVDRKEGRNTGQWQMASSVASAGDAKAVAASWAKVLRNGLDKAHGTLKTKDKK